MCTHLYNDFLGFMVGVVYVYPTHTHSRTFKIILSIVFKFLIILIQKVIISLNLWFSHFLIGIDSWPLFLFCCTIYLYSTFFNCELTFLQNFLCNCKIFYFSTFMAIWWYMQCPQYLNHLSPCKMMLYVFIYLLFHKQQSLFQSIY